MSLRSFATSDEEGVLAGVGAGIAQALGVDATLVRLIFALLALAGGAGIALYLALWAYGSSGRRGGAALLGIVAGPPPPPRRAGPRGAGAAGGGRRCWSSSQARCSCTRWACRIARSSESRSRPPA